MRTPSHPYAFFDLHVLRSAPLGPSMVRVTFGGTCLDGRPGGFATGGRDQRFKIFLPHPHQDAPVMPDAPSAETWFADWRALDPAERGIMRSYTVRAQRPGELDATILSQCNSIFAMRLGNERDQEIIKGALRGGARSMAGFLSSIANREAIAFGEAFSTPMRLTFETVPAHQLPGRRKAESLTSSLQVDDRIALDRIVDRLRSFENNAHPGAPEKPTDDSNLLEKPSTISRLETVAVAPIAPERPAPIVSHNSETAQSMKKLGDLVRNFRKDYES